MRWLDSAISMSRECPIYEQSKTPFLALVNSKLIPHAVSGYYFPAKKKTKKNIAPISIIIILSQGQQ